MGRNPKPSIGKDKMEKTCSVKVGKGGRLRMRWRNLLGVFGSRGRRSDRLRGAVSGGGNN